MNALRSALRSALRCALLSVSFFAGSAHAHPLAPALLSLAERADGQVEVEWRTSVSQAKGAAVAPRIATGCRAATPTQRRFEDGEALVERWTLACDGGLEGKTFAVDGLERAGINVILRVARADHGVTQQLLDASAPAATIRGSRGPGETFAQWFLAGGMHLLQGLDHALFVAGLALLLAGLRARVVTLTAFTLGHSVTLALATLGLVRLPAAPVELGIALSLAWLAVRLAADGARSTGSAPGLGFGFGLLHGLGFAAAFGAAGVPAGELPRALLAFNVGIEAGQLLLLVVLWLAAEAGRRVVPAAGALAGARLAAVYGIGTLAAYWCWARAALML
jgi:hydrogenase/urease accessory protein HupE